MAVRDAQLACQIFQGMVSEKILADMRQRRTGKLAADLHHAGTRRELRPASLARTVSRYLCLRRMREEIAVFTERCFHPANRAAIDSSRFDRNKKSPDETPVAG